MVPTTFSPFYSSSSITPIITSSNQSNFPLTQTFPSTTTAWIIPGGFQTPTGKLFLDKLFLDLKILDIFFSFQNKRS
jgi:hypothetical protein